MPNEKFTLEFLKFLGKNFNTEKHKVIVYNIGENFTKQEFKYVKYIERIVDDEKVLLNEAKKADKIIVHSFYSMQIIKFFSKYIKLANKAVFIVWGAEAYNNRYYLLENKGLNLKIRITEILKRRIIRRVPEFMTFAAPDYDLLKLYYGVKGKQFDCLYPSNIDRNFLDKLLQNKKEIKSEFFILLGNSATKTNQHKEMIEILSNYKDKNIKVICPLSYGDIEYRDEIVRYGKKVFNEKFIPILEYMTPKEYSSLLSKIDVAVFNHNRQQGTGNIEILSYMGAKLFIRSDTTTWGHYVVRDKCRFFDTLMIKDSDFDEFVKISEDDRKVNRNYFKNIWDERYVKSLWDKVFIKGI